MRFIGRGRTRRRAAGDDRRRQRCRAARARCSIRSSRSAIASTLEPEQTATIDIVSGVGRDARGRAGAGREIPGPAPRRSRVRAGVDAQPGGAAPDQCHRGRRAALRRASPSSVIYANASLRAEPGVLAQEPARAVGAVGLRDLGRPADRAAADRRRGQHRPRAPARAGARVLAPEGAGRRSRDLERGSRRLPAACCRTRSWG